MKINYELIQEYADKHKLNYNELCIIVRNSTSEANSTAAPAETKKVYIKPLRTIVEVQAAYADQIRDWLNAAPVDAGVREADLDWPVYDDGEAPWSEDEQFEERRKACKARTKKFGECGGEGDYEGQCDDCDYDAQDVLRKKYRPAPSRLSQ